MEARDIDALAASIAAEAAARDQMMSGMGATIAALAARLDGSADARIDRLVGIIEQQGKQIAELATHVGLLVQAVAQLLGEEAGAPVQDEGAEPERVDLDGKPY
ncbi:hypothetical protein [Stenotrophomonas maltophilia]|uniref:hypothetical protein n=1 Tax=Stenotrophomonas maltophilia TaxID=40324 RepID=UPI00041D3973|nr:hypothetical protein [Stenotrophomonas maltophilia]KOQ68194.1 hypothetical protein ABW43_15000 [Stenotrophomonas maltophilia]MBN5078267.1 hypothetical protein [Stenotrophomonas maltophilia]MBN5107984.1 hypothetical protein [Stenotrophomonas maltophilia]PSD16341.1 hypothetical protein C7E19_08020 [Stenotrophomonas maltophilia]